MQVNVEMLLLSGGLVSAAQGGLLLYFWRRNRAALYLAWWGASFLVGGLLRVFVELLPYSFDERNFLGILVIMLAYGMSWQGVRTFGGRPVVLPMVFLPPACWIVIGFSGLFDNGSVAQMRAVSFLYAFTWAVTAFEFMRAQGVSLTARMPMIVLCSATAAAYIVRIILTPTVPYPIGAAPTEAWAYSVLFFVSIITTIPFGAFALALSREHAHAASLTSNDAWNQSQIRSRNAFFANMRLPLRQYRMRNDAVCMSVIHIDTGAEGGPLDLAAFEDLLCKFECSARAIDQFSIVGRAELATVLCRWSATEAQNHYLNLLNSMERTCRRQGWKVRIGVASTDAVGYDVNALIDAAHLALFAARRDGQEDVVIFNPSMRPQIAGDSSRDIPLAVAARSVQA